MKKRRKADRPLADRSLEQHDELGPNGPRVARFSKAEDAEAASEAGVRAAGDSDRPCGTHAAPEHPTDEPRAETGVDRVFGIIPDDPDAPEPTARPRGE